MVLNTRIYNQISKEMSRIIRNIRLQYKHLVKIQIMNVKTMDEIKLFIYHPTYPFNRFTFLITIPKTYPDEPLCVEPIDVSDEMRKHFIKEQFKFFRMKCLIESILHFCSMYQDQQIRGSSVRFPDVGDERNNFLNQCDSLMSISDIIHSSQTRSISRVNLMKKYCEKIISYSNSHHIDQYKKIVDMISNNKFQTNFRHKYFRHNDIFKSVRSFYSDHFQRRIERRKAEIYETKDTIYCSIDYINCLALNSYLENTVEYIFLHKDVDIYAANTDNLNLSSLSKHQYMISSFIETSGFVPTKPHITTEYMDSFISFSEMGGDKFLEDDNVTELGQNFQIVKKLMHEEITVKTIKSLYLFSSNDVVIIPRSTLEPPKKILKKCSSNVEVQTSLYNPLDTEPLIVLLIQTVSYLAYVIIDQSILDYPSVVSEESNLSSANDSLNPYIPKLNLTLEDYLIIYESDIEYFKEFNLSTTLTQFKSSQINVYNVNVISLYTAKSCQQSLLSEKFFDYDNNMERKSSLMNLESMYEICLQRIHLPTKEITYLSNEIDFTLDLNLNFKEQIRILNFFNIPTSPNQFQTLEFFIPIKLSNGNHQCLIKDCSQSSSKNCIRIHRIKSNSILHNYFLQKSKFQNSYNEINRKMFFQPLCGIPFWILHNMLSYLFILQSKSSWKRSEKMIKKYLDLSQICVHQTYFCQESSDFLNNLLKSVT